MDPVLLMVHRASRAGEDAEPVIIDVGTNVITFALDDGEVLVFDRTELAAALGLVPLAGLRRAA